MKFSEKSIAVTLALVFFAFSCTKDEKINPGTPPEIPPAGTMVMDFSNFTDDGSAGGRMDVINNWGQAALVVGVWNTIIGVTLAVPVAAFKASIHQTPEYDSDNSLWIWNFDYDFVGKTYTAELTAALVNDGVEWKMYISQEGGFQDVLWYSGQMNTGATQGNWVLNQNPENPVEFMQIDWERDGDQIKSIKYTDITPDSDNNGNYIEYGKTGDTDLNTYYNLYSASDGDHVNIEWNDSTGAGRIQFNDGDYQCWDETFQDTVCN